MLTEVERLREDVANAVDETERWKQAFSDHENDRNRTEFALRAEIERLRVNRDNSCTCPHGDASEPLHNHERTCPIHVHKMKRIAPEVALDRLAGALDSGDENELLRDALKEALRMIHPSTAGSYTDEHKRTECDRLTKVFALVEGRG